jgi:AcrR family transcriptional regulator
MTYDERLDYLLSEAAKIFADKGFHSTSMRDLSRAAELSLAGIYHYVKSKDELLFHIQRRCFTEVLEGARAAVRAVADPEQRLQVFIGHHVTFFAAHMAEMKVLSHEADSLSGDHLAVVNDLKRQYGELLLEQLQGVAVGDVGSVDPRVATYALFGMLNWIYTWYDPTGPVSPDRLADQFATIYLNGVVAAPSGAQT